MAHAAIRHRSRTSTPHAERPPLETLSLSELKVHARALRKHSERQISRLADGIRQFGFLCPVVVDATGTIIAGHARYAAAQKAGLSEIPVVRASHLSEAQARAFRLADNKLAELAEWDAELLKIELTDLSALDLDFSIELTGFSTAEIDVVLDGPVHEADAAEDVLPQVPPSAVTQPGDLWKLGAHLLYCGDACDAASFQMLLGENRARLVISDAPYNVKVDGHVGGRGKRKHREFAMASGEMSREQFTGFLASATTNLKDFSTDGSLHFLFMDHRHMEEILAACAKVYIERLNVLVWKKSNAGMGALYRSQHELIFVYKNGSAPHVNNIELGANGRHRTNVLEYPGANTFRRGRDEELALHPTPKTVGLIADLIRDASKIGDLVLDCFVGSGTIFIAAEKTRRRAAGIEIDPVYCDVAIQRWEQLTGQTAIHAASGLSMSELRVLRAVSPDVDAADAATEARHG